MQLTNRGNIKEKIYKVVKMAIKNSSTYKIISKP